jgi:hypothetical protein
MIKELEQDGKKGLWIESDKLVDCLASALIDAAQRSCNSAGKELTENARESFHKLAEAQTDGLRFLVALECVCTGLVEQYGKVEDVLQKELGGTK